MSDVTHFESEAEDRRRRIVATMAEITERVDPRNILRDAKEEGRQTLLGVRDDGMRALGDVRDSLLETFDDVEGAVRDNPAVAGLAAAAIGVALTAALAPRRAASAPDDEYAAYAGGDPYVAAARSDGARARLRGAGSAIARAADGAVDRLDDGLHSARDAARTAADRARVAAREATEVAGQRLKRARARTADAADDAAAFARRTGDDLARTVEANPEATVIVGVIAGAALAFFAMDETDRDGFIL